MTVGKGRRTSDIPHCRHGTCRRDPKDLVTLYLSVDQSSEVDSLRASELHIASECVDHLDREGEPSSMITHWRTHTHVMSMCMYISAITKHVVSYAPCSVGRRKARDWITSL